MQRYPMNEVPDTSKPQGRGPISARFLLIAVAIIVVGYFAGLKAMELVMLQQERAKATAAPIAPPSFSERPEGLTFGAGGN